MTDSPPAEKKRKGMLGFYVGLGVVAALLVGGWFAWTPLRVSYYRRRVASLPDGRERLDAGVALARIGPPAEQALRELISSEDVLTRSYAVAGMHNGGSVFWLPLLVEASRDPEDYIADRAIHAVHERSRRTFDRPFDLSGSETLKAQRKMVLDWWEREGKAQYERDAE